MISFAITPTFYAKRFKIKTVSKRLILILLSLTLLGQVHCNNESGNRAKKRSKDPAVTQKSNRVQFNLYDQVAEESDQNSGSNSYGMKIKENNHQSLNPNYNDHVTNGYRNGPRNPRAEPNYVRNYNPSYPRGDGGGSWDGNANGRQMSSFNLNSLQSAASSSPSEYIYGDGYVGEPQDNIVAAGHNHGWGHQSHGHGKGQSPVNNSAVGLLGFLSLLSLIQSVLRQMTTTAAGGGRKRREADDNHPTESDVTYQLLPFLAQVGHVRDGLVPLKCVQRPMCIANSIISSRLGDVGAPVCDHLSAIMELTIKDQNLRPKWREARAIRGIKNASKAGIDRKNCVKLYPHCKQLDEIAQNNSTSNKNLMLLLPNMF